MAKSNAERKRPVTVFLDRSDFEKLREICERRGQSRADFLRAAISVAKSVPATKTRPLSGACLERHLARLRREKAPLGAKRKRK